MKLCEKFSRNERAEYVISKMREVSKTKAFDVICAYNLFAKLNKDINAEAENCLDLAFVMCKYMKPEAEDVISMILCYNQHKNHTAVVVHIFESKLTCEHVFDNSKQLFDKTPDKLVIKRNNCNQCADM